MFQRKEERSLEKCWVGFSGSQTLGLQVFCGAVLSEEHLLGGNEVGLTRQREKFKCSSVVTRASADTMGSFEVGMSLQPVLSGGSGLVAVYLPSPDLPLHTTGEAAAEGEGGRAAQLWVVGAERHSFPAAGGASISLLKCGRGSRHRSTAFSSYVKHKMETM